MQKIAAVMTCFWLIPLLASGSEPPSDFERYWPQWRGPYATGVAPYGDPPLAWNETKNVRWKIELPGRGHATPIVWDDRVFVTTAIQTDKSVAPPMSAEVQEQTSRPRHGRMRGNQPTHIVRFAILALNRRDGRVLWQRTAREELPHEGTHATGSWASNSSVTDGKHLFAYFGSRGLYCLDLEGNLKWQKDLGDMATRHSFGEGSSPVLHGDTIVINWDHEGQSFIVALDKNSGEELWRVDRDERTSWATPIVVAYNGKPQVITSATNRVRAYDLTTGQMLWECGGMTVNTIPSPVSADGIVYVTSGFRGSALLAIRLAAAKGDISGSEAIIWKHDQDTPYVPSPLLYGDTIYFLKGRKGILSCFNARTGQAFYGPQRLDGIKDVYASPVGASDRIYLAGRDGTTLVIQRGPEFKLLATNSLDDGFDASPAIVDQELFLRGRKHLYCLARN